MSVAYLTGQFGSGLAPGAVPAPAPVNGHAVLRYTHLLQHGAEMIPITPVRLPIIDGVLCSVTGVPSTTTPIEVQATDDPLLAQSGVLAQVDLVFDAGAAPVQVFLQLPTDKTVSISTGASAGAPGAVFVAGLTDAQLLELDEAVRVARDAKIAAQNAEAEASGIASGVTTQVQGMVPDLVAGVIADDPSVVAKAAALAADGVGVVSTANVPAIADNRAIDPQAKYSGYRVANPYIFSHITSGLPTGFSSGLRTTLTGTNGAYIGQIGFGFEGSGNLPVMGDYSIPVVPGEVISLSCLVWTDQPGALASIDLKYRDASGGLITNVYNTASAIAKSTWTLITLRGVIVPAGAAFVGPQPATKFETGVPPEGAEMRTTGVRVASGTPSDLSYGDGASLGWAWRGVRDKSASVQVFLPTADTQTLIGLPARVSALESETVADGRVTLTKSGETATIRSVVGGKNLDQTVLLDGSSNGAVNLTEVTYDGITVNTATDEVTPIHTFAFVGGNHGYPTKSFANPDNKTTADLGSLWTDTAGREYVLLDIVGGRLVIGGSYTTAGGGAVTSGAVAPVTNLTHVSGASKTGPIIHTTGQSAQVWPSIGRISVGVWADGTEISADGVYSVSDVAVRETYDVWDYASLYEMAKTNIGVPYHSLDIAGVVRISNTFRWDGNGRCQITMSMDELKPVALAPCGGVQSMPMRGGTDVTRYLPGVGSVGGYNWTDGVELDTYSTAVEVRAADLKAAGHPPAFALDVLSAPTTLGFALGYMAHGKRGDETSTSSSRATRSAGRHWHMYSSRKSYPQFTDGEDAGWGRMTCEAFRVYLSSDQVAPVLAAKDDARTAWEALNATTGLTT